MYRLIGITLLLLIGRSAFAQVKITVVDQSSGQSLEGVSIAFKHSGKEHVLLTDETGVASISNVSFPVIIHASHIGYASQELQIDKEGGYSIRLVQTSSQLDEVVVTGQFEPQSISQSVVKVKTISAEMIRAKGATRLQDVLTTELNVRFTMDPALGVSSMSLQGMSGQNVKVLIDGVPVIGRQGTTNDIDINQLNLNSIERIEIVEGPMSTIYGADALAGVINIITKKPEKDKFTATARVHEENIGNEYSLFKKGIRQQNVGLGYRGKSFYTLADFGRNFSGGWTGDSTGREKQWHPKTQWIGGGVVGIQRDAWNVSYRLDYLNERLYDPAQFSGSQALDRNYITNRFMHQVQGSVEFNDRLSYNGAIAYTDYSRETQAVVVDAATGEKTLALSGQDITQYDAFTIRGTVLYRISSKFSLQPGYDINIESGSGGRLMAGTNRINDYAGFLSAELKPVKFLTLRPGFRFVQNSVYQAPPVLPSLNAKIDLSSRHDVRLSYGRGFRAPSLRELYFYFYDSSHQLEGNPDLEAELSHSFNASWTWRVLIGPVSYTTVVSGFYNSVNNLITNAQRPNSTVTTYMNVDVYKTQGITLNNSVNAGSLKAAAGFAYTGRYNQLLSEDSSLPQFNWSPEINASLSYEFSKAGITANAYYKYTGKTPFYQQDFSTTPATVFLAQAEEYHWADASIQKTFLTYLNVVVGTRNLFDVTRVRSTAISGGAHTTNNNSLASGRSYYVTLSVNF